MNTRTYIVIAFVVGLITGAGGLYFFGVPSLSGNSVDHTVSQLRTGSTKTIDDSTSRYENHTYGFSLTYPKELSVGEFEEGGGAMTVVFQKPDEKIGFQIFVVPYEEETITTERIRQDIPSGTVKNPTDIILAGTITATHFESESPVIGTSSEVWFIKDGYLYEITTYAALDSWLAGILSTLEF